MSDIKCPICNKPMKEQIDGTCISYQETDCICNIAAPKIIWKEMAALRKKHNIFTKSMCMDKEFAEEECVRLQNELDRTRKALDVAVGVLKGLKPEKAKDGGYWTYRTADVIKVINKALEQINKIKGGK